MHRRMTIALIVLIAAALVLLVSAARARAEARLATEPAEAPPKRALTSHELDDLTAEIRVASRLAAVFSGLALVGVLWVGWSQRAIARNQVELGAMIQSLRARPD